jgi:hypothetical protein
LTPSSPCSRCGRGRGWGLGLGLGLGLARRASSRRLCRPRHALPHTPPLPRPQPPPPTPPPKVGSVDSLDQYDARFDFASPGSLDRLQSLLDASHHGSDGSSHRGRRPASRAGSSVSLDDEPSGAVLAPAGDYRDKSWNQPPPNFRFDFGGWSDGGGAAAAAKTAATAAPAPAPDGGDAGRAWPGLTVGAPGTPGGMLLPGGGGFAPRGPLAANGTVRAGGHFDKRMHGASLYRNMLVNHGPAALETVKE